MDRETATLGLAVVTILGVFVAISPLLPTNSEKFSELGVLGPDQKIGGYPTTIRAGQQFILYGYVGNHEGAPSYYEVLVKVGNQSTAVSNATAANAQVIFSHLLVLSDNSSATFRMTLSMPNAGLNQRLIFELWSLNSTTTSFTYTGLWNQVWVNVTAR